MSNLKPKWQHTCVFIAITFCLFISDTSLLYADQSTCESSALKAEEYFLKLREQYSAITLKAEYTIQNKIKRSDSDLVKKVCYLRDGARFNIRCKLFLGEKEQEEYRYNYDGVNLTRYHYVPGSTPSHTAIVVSEKVGMYHIGDDLLVMMGLNNYLGGKEYPDHEVSIVGNEIVEGHPCTKLQMIAHYLAEKKAYIYFWVSQKPFGFTLVKTNCLIEDDSRLLLYETVNHYDKESELIVSDYVENRRYNESATNLVKHVTLKLDQITLNPEIDPNAFDCILPPQTLIQYE